MLNQYKTICHKCAVDCAPGEAKRANKYCWLCLKCYHEWKEKEKEDAKNS